MTHTLESHAAFINMMQSYWHVNVTRYEWTRTVERIDGAMAFAAGDPCFDELELLEAIAYERGLMAMRP